MLEAASYYVATTYIRNTGVDICHSSKRENKKRSTQMYLIDDCFRILQVGKVSGVFLRACCCPHHRCTHRIKSLLLQQQKDAVVLQIMRKIIAVSDVTSESFSSTSIVRSVVLQIVEPAKNPQSVVTIYQKATAVFCSLREFVGFVHSSVNICKKYIYLVILLSNITSVKYLYALARWVCMHGN